MNQSTHFRSKDNQQYKHTCACGGSCELRLVRTHFLNSFSSILPPSCRTQGATKDVRKGKEGLARRGRTCFDGIRTVRVRIKASLVLVDYWFLDARLSTTC